MSIALPEKLTALLNKPDTIKVLVTIDTNGSPHTAVKNTFRLDEEKRLIYYELLESSVTNKNLVRSLWFEHPVSVAVIGSQGESYQIKGRPVKSLVSGLTFRDHYVGIRKKLGDVDLAAVWVIEPLEVIDQTFATRKQQEDETRPYFKHLDRLAK